jgi:hypothetical protein
VARRHPAPHCSAAAQTSAISMRSLNDPRQATVKPLSFPPRHLQAKTTHPSQSACKFRLLLNGLAASAPRQMFCSCRQLQEAMVAEPTPIRHASGGLVHVSERVKRWHVDTGRHTAAPILLSESSAPVFGNQDAIAQRSSPELVRPAPVLQLFKDAIPSTILTGARFQSRLHLDHAVG